MARLFNDAASEYLQIESPVVTAYPFAMACWFNSNDDTAGQGLIWVGDKDSAQVFTSLYADGAIAGDYVGAYSHNYGSAAIQLAYTSTGYTANVWHHAAGIFLNASERHAYIDGGSKGSNTGTVGAMSAHDRTAIGGLRDSSAGGYMSGDIAEAAVWDLTDWGANDAARELAFEKAIAAMGKGFTPGHFPLGLVAYWPLIRGLNDRVGGYNLTASGTTVADHPRIINPFTSRKLRTPSVVSATGFMTCNAGIWGS